MNHEQWEALKAATQGHTPGPWLVCQNNGDVETRDYILFMSRADEPTNDSTLAAAAPDLLAEVERLRGWMHEIELHVAYGGVAAEQIRDALTGAEVPK